MHPSTTLTTKAPHSAGPGSIALNLRSAFHRALRLTTCLSLASFTLRCVVAQTTSTGSIESDEPVVLSPFTVNAGNDVGFVAASSLAGGRIATALKDTPVAYSVITSEFLEALNLTDAVQAAAWTVNSQSDVADGNNQTLSVNSPVSNTRLRGTGVNAPTRNFFPFFVTPDSYNLDRVDFARGPNAVLFGAGGIGGTVNSVTKQALTNTPLRAVKLQVGSYNKLRATGDYNRPFAGERGAVRLNVMKETADTWRDYEWTERWGVALASKFKLTEKLSVRVEGEVTERKENKALTSIRDRLSSWDGKTTFDGIPAVPLTQAQRSAAGVAASNPMRWVTNVNFPAGTLLNFQDMHYSAALGQNATLANTGRINGVPIVTPGFSLGDTAVVDDYAGIPTDRWAAIQSGSPFFTPPTREQTPLWTSHIPTFQEKGKDLAVYFNYQLGENLFIEVAGDVNRSDRIGNTAMRRGAMDLYMDLQKTLPNGAANPGFLHPYTEFMEYRNLRNDDVKNMRVQGVYSREFNKGWFNGKMNFSLMGGINIERNEARARTLLLPLTEARVGSGTTAVNFTGLDGRSWVDNIEYSEFGVYTRLYLDQKNRDYQPIGETPITIKNPVTGATQQIAPKWVYDTRRVDNNKNSLKKYKYFQTAGNFDLFHNKLVLIGAFRRDFAEFGEERVVQPGYEKPGWDGNSLTFRQAAPADYQTLMYSPRNAAGVITGPPVSAAARPILKINNINAGNPLYANDRFQDDYNAPYVHPIINTYTFGGVVNVLPWLGLYANRSQTFSLQGALTKIDGSLVEPTASIGDDYGIRVTLPSGRLSINFGRFTSDQDKNAFNQRFDFKDSYNRIANAPVIGDLSPTGRNQRNVGSFPDNVYDTTTRHVEGYELEITANLTPAWRLLLNAAKTDGVNSNQSPDTIAYFASHDAVSRLILADAGVLIDSQNNASINPIYNDPTKINVGRVQTAVDGWNTIEDVLKPNIISAPQPVNGISKWVGNVSTDYRFSSGFMKGIRVNVGVRYRGPMGVGYRGSDTIVDPNDPTKAIDDPTVDGTTPVQTPAQWITTCGFSYTFKLKHRNSLRLDLNVDNVLNDEDVIYTTAFASQGTTYLRPRTTISSPARITVPGAFSYSIPRNYAVSATWEF
ncbi:MAG: TonB-dependent receptor plug domain-containing protein [Opitutus sp.]